MPGSDSSSNRTGIQVAQVVRSVSGPLPPPEMLAQYNQVIPGLADRIVAMAEKEQQQAHKMQQGQLRYFGRGQIFGFFIALSFLIAAIWLAMQEHDVVAGILGGTTIVGIVAVFVLGYLHPGKEDHKEDHKE